MTTMISIIHSFALSHSHTDGISVMFMIDWLIVTDLLACGSGRPTAVPGRNGLA